jgi:hypothetical protein
MNIIIFPYTMKYFLAALCFYQSLIQGDADAIMKDPDLKLFFDPNDSFRFPVHEELDRVKHLTEEFDKMLKYSEEMGAHTIQISRSYVPHIKSVCQLYLKHIESKRNDLASRPNITRYVLKIVDQKLSALREKTELGVFEKRIPGPGKINFGAIRAGHGTGRMSFCPFPIPLREGMRKKGLPNLPPLVNGANEIPS